MRDVAVPVGRRRSVTSTAIGVGKRHIAQGVGHIATWHGADVRFTNASRVLATLASANVDGARIGDGPT
jgi:DNA replication protein DnaC